LSSASALASTSWPRPDLDIVNVASKMRKNVGCIHFVVVSLQVSLCTNVLAVCYGVLVSRQSVTHEFDDEPMASSLDPTYAFHWLNDHRAHGMRKENFDRISLVKVQLSLTNRATHKCKCNHVADLLKHAPMC